jgi:hypothetical protein
MVTSGLESESMSCLTSPLWENTKHLYSILIHNAPIQEGVEILIFVIDWEQAQLGVPTLDHGEMIGELYAFWLYKKIDDGLWMMQGYCQVSLKTRG